MDDTAVLNILLHGNQLKRTARTGWTQRGVADAENVAAHSFGVVYTAMILAQVIDEPLNLERVLMMAALHDLPEGLTSDIPTPAWRFLPPGIKVDVERSAMADMLGDAPFADPLLDVWEELHAGETAEARLVDDADKLELFIQALMYEQQTGNRQLREFWATPHVFNFAQCQALYGELRARRPMSEKPGF